MNWTLIAQNAGSVAVVFGPIFLMHYRKIAAVLDAVTKILDQVNTASKDVTPTAVVNTQPPTNGGMVN